MSSYCIQAFYLALGGKNQTLSSGLEPHGLSLLKMLSTHLHFFHGTNHLSFLYCDCIFHCPHSFPKGWVSHSHFADKTSKDPDKLSSLQRFLQWGECGAGITQCLSVSKASVTLLVCLVSLSQWFSDLGFGSMQTSGAAGLLMSVHLVSIIIEMRVNNATLCFHHS